MSDINKTSDLLDLDEALEKNTKVLKSASSGKSIATQLVVSNLDKDRLSIPRKATGVVTKVFNLPTTNLEEQELSYDNYYASKISATSENTEFSK